MAKVLSALFFDKLRGFATLLALLIIATSLLANQFFPRPVKLDQTTTETIIEAADVMRKAASNMEQIALDNYQFRESVSKEMSLQADLRGANYAKIYEQYGLGSLPTPSSYGGGSVNGLQQQTDPKGSGHLPPGKDDPVRTEQLQYPTTYRANPTGNSATGVPGGNSPPPAKQSRGSGELSGKQ